METTHVDGISEKNKDNSGINNERQDDFREWVNTEVVGIVKKYQKAEDFCQEKWAIEFNVDGDHEGSFSLLINQDDNLQNKIQVIPREYKDADITVVGEWKEIKEILKRKTTLKMKMRKKKANCKH